MATLWGFVVTAMLYAGVAVLLIVGAVLVGVFVFEVVSLVYAAWLRRKERRRQEMVRDLQRDLAREVMAIESDFQQAVRDLHKYARTQREE